MPTGYTAIIEDNPDVTFRQYALRCARGMGACVMQRDDPMDDPPKAVPPSDYHEKRLAELFRKRDELSASSTESLRAIWQAERDRVDRENAKDSARANELRARYVRMRAEAERWQPPTPEHAGLKSLMLEQIDACAGDCRPFQSDPPKPLEEWLSERLSSIELDIAYHKKNHAKEVQNAAVRAAWISALYESLPAEDAPPR